MNFLALKPGLIFIYFCQVLIVKGSMFNKKWVSKERLQKQKGEVWHLNGDKAKRECHWFSHSRVWFASQDPSTWTCWKVSDIQHLHLFILCIQQTYVEQLLCPEWCFKFGGTMVNRPDKVMSPCLYSTGHLGVGKVGEGWKVGEAHGLDPFQKHIYSSSLYWKHHGGRKDFASFSFFHTELVFNKYPLTQCWILCFLRAVSFGVRYTRPNN